MARAHLLGLRSLFTSDVIYSDSFPLSSDGSENVTFAVENVDEFAVVRQVRDDAQFELRVVGCEEHSAWSTRQHKCVKALMKSLNFERCKNLEKGRKRDACSLQHGHFLLLLAGRAGAEKCASLYK